MIEHLFGSKTRAHLLRTFFRQPERAFYVRELTRLLDVQINAIRRELELLVGLGLIKEADGGQESFSGEEDDASKEIGYGLRKYYILDQDAVLFAELRALLVKARLLDEQELTRELAGKGGSVDLLLLTGCFTADKRAPSDILLVGRLKERAIAGMMKKYERKFGFPIRYTTMSKKEFFERRQMMDGFLFSMFEADHVKVVNELGV